MRVSTDDELIEYYQRELSYLRRMGLEFSRRYPKIAGRLELGIDQSPDPHVERLLESFAFLTGRIQRNLDSESTRITSALLDLLYPHYLTPVPSVAIARFVPEPKLGKMTTAYRIEKGTPLFAQSAQDLKIRFRTTYPVDLYPVAVTDCGFESTSKYDFLDRMPKVATVLRIRLHALEGSLKEVVFGALRFYLNGERSVVNELYELLVAHCLKIAIITDGGKKPQFLKVNEPVPVGFSSNEDVLPYHGNAHPQYRLLQEYFNFPEKFGFIDISGLEEVKADKYFDILLLLDQLPGTRVSLDRESMLLGCTPVINLFRKLSEPIRVDHRLVEYPLVPDLRREESTEIHTILKVSGTGDSLDETQNIQPFFSYDHVAPSSKQRVFWSARRVATGREGVPGTDLLLSLHDLDFQPARSPNQVIFAHTLCMNRHLAKVLPAGARLQIEEAAPVKEIYCVTKPSAQADPPMDGQTQWRLISHLSLNYLSLSSDRASINALREILKLYDFNDDPSVNNQINGIVEMATRQVLRRVGQDAWRGFCRGTEITLTFDEALYVGSSAFLMASVLNQFFALYTSINSFTQLVIKSTNRKGNWKSWPPMVGEQIVV